MRREGHTQTWPKSFAEIVRNPRNDPIRGKGGIDALVVARGHEQPERGVVTQSGVHREGRSDTPGIFRIEAEAADALRKRAVGWPSCIDRWTIRIGIQRRAGPEHSRVRNVEGWILWVAEN